jgi:hypothetical protein
MNDTKRNYTQNVTNVDGFIFLLMARLLILWERDDVSLG